MMKKKDPFDVLYWVNYAMEIDLSLLVPTQLDNMNYF